MGIIYFRSKQERRIFRSIFRFPAITCSVIKTEKVPVFFINLCTQRHEAQYKYPEGETPKQCFDVVSGMQTFKVLRVIIFRKYFDFNVSGFCIVFYDTLINSKLTNEQQ